MANPQAEYSLKEAGVSMTGRARHICAEKRPLAGLGELGHA